MTHANPLTADDEDVSKMSEVFDAHIPRVDLVSRAANGTRFVIAKSDAGPSLLDPATVAELIEKNEGAHMTDALAPVDETPVTKADGEPDLDVTKPLDESGVTPKDSPNVPGSPGWETVDADTAAKWVGILARARNAIATLATREDVELVAGVATDGMAGYELSEANMALDYAIDILAAYGANEKAEAMLADELDGITKAIALLDPATLDMVEQHGTTIMKAGRVLSSKNEGLLRDAAANLTTVLAALPSAPESVEKKESTVTDATPTATDETPVAKSEIEPEAEPMPKTEEPESVEKADAKKMTAVFNQDGKLIGVVKPEQIVSVEGGGEPAKPEADEPAADDLDPAPAPEVGDPTDAPAEEPVEKSAPSTETGDLSPEQLVKAANDGEDVVAKALASIVTAQHDEIEVLKSLPARGGPIANGAGLPTPDALNMRGQDNGASSQPADVAELRKAMQDAESPAAREAAANKLQEYAAAEHKRLVTSQPTVR